MKIHVFRTPRWCANPHVQTSWGAFFRKIPRVATEIHQVPLRDGHVLNADFAKARGHHKMTCIVLHGLTGSANSHYVRGIQKKVAEHIPECATFAVNHRGSLGHACPSLQSPQLYHAGLEEDIQDAIQYVRQTWPETSIQILGISLSGNMVVRALGLGLLPDVERAMAVSVPFELAAAANKVDQGIGPLYRRYLVERMKDIIRHKVDYLPLLPKDVCLDELHSFWAFDNFVVAPIHGFRNVHQYYKVASSRQFVPAIQQPLLVVQSMDDPLVPASVWPSSSMLPECVAFEAYDRGGHVGFMSHEGYWLETRVVQWLRDH